MQEVVVLRAADDCLQPRHGALQHRRQVSQIDVVDSEKICLVHQWQDVNLPLETAGERFNGDEFFAAFHHVLTDVDLAPDFARIAVVNGGFEGQCFVDQRAEDAVVVFAEILAAVVDFVLYVLRYHRHGNDLAVGVRNRGAGGRAEILEHQHVFQARIRGEYLRHAVAIGTKQHCQMVGTHVVHRRAVLEMVDDDLVAAIAVDGLLQAEAEIGLIALVAQYRIEVFDDADLPVATRRISQYLWWRAVFIATTERAGFNVLAGVARRQRLGLFRTHAARRGHQHRLARHNRVDTDFAYFVWFAHVASL